MTEHDMRMIKPDSEGTEPAGDPAPDIDRLSLIHALHDFEVANARVVDLTQRLIGTGRELAAAKEDVAALQGEYETLRIAHEQIQRSRAFKLATRIGAIRNLL